MQAIQSVKTRFFSTLAASLLLISCVTINIYFPAAAAEKAADRIIEDVWGKQPEADAPAATAAPVPAPATDAPAADKTSHFSDPVRRPFAISLLDAIISPAHAAEADINIATPAIDKLRASMKSRHGSLQAFYNSGAVGLTANALIAEKDADAISLKDRNRVKQLVNAENDDRTALYRAIAEANEHPEWLDDIRSTFARQWVSNARSGWWYQDGSGSWKQK